MIPKRKSNLTSEGKIKDTASIWIVAGILFVLVSIAILIVSFSSKPNYISHPQTIHLDDLGIKEWEKFDEISKQTLAAEEPESVEPPPDTANQDPFLINGKIRKNQTIFAALKSHGLDGNDIQQVIAALQNVVDFRKSKPGDKYEVQLDVDRRILSFKYIISPEDITIAQRNGNDYIASKVDVHKKVERILVAGTLTTSLYQAFIDLGESGELASHFMQLFKYDIDFGNDSQVGDEFSVLVDKVTLNGEFYRYERVWAATYTSGTRKRTLEAYYFDTNDDYAGFYDADGNALKKTFLKTPVVGCFISSPFNPKRFHPILKRIKPHNGTDWACNTGTPVMAFADGIVTFADWKGGNGNLLVIEHAHGYTSLYAHLYNFARGIKKGAKVKQGQIVAQVGNTGISTGPHLHFAVKIDGKYVDPVALDSRHAFTLSGNRLHAFIQKRDRFRQTMHELTPVSKKPSSPETLPSQIDDSALSNAETNENKREEPVFGNPPDDNLPASPTAPETPSDARPTQDAEPPASDESDIQFQAPAQIDEPVPSFLQ